MELLIMSINDFIIYWLNGPTVLAMVAWVVLQVRADKTAWSAERKNRTFFMMAFVTCVAAWFSRVAVLRVGTQAGTVAIKDPQNAEIIRFFGSDIIFGLFILFVTLSWLGFVLADTQALLRFKLWLAHEKIKKEQIDITT